MSKAGSHPNYIAIFLWLAGLTVLELGVNFLPWSKVVLILILAGLAIWKALLVGLYFMHVRWEGKRLRIFVLAPLPLTVIIIAAVLTEYVWGYG